MAVDPFCTRILEWLDPAPLAARLREGPARAVYEAMAAGSVPPPPSAVLLGFRPIAVGDGTATFSYTPHESHYNPMGTVHGGILASVYDAALGTAVATRLAAGTGYTTLDLQTRFLRPVTVATGPLTCTATALHVGRTAASAEAHLRDGAGTLHGHATASCIVLRP